MPKALQIQLEDAGQMFAGVATIRAAAFDVIDSEQGEWFFADPSLNEDEQNQERTMFVDRLIKRIAELQSPPHDGIKLENLCDLHKRRALPHPTTAVCVQCQKERAGNG